LPASSVASFPAVARHQYLTPGVRPPMTTGDPDTGVVTTPVMKPASSARCTWYPVRGAPPSSLGAPRSRVAAIPSGELATERMVGAVGDSAYWYSMPRVPVKFP